MIKEIFMAISCGISAALFFLQDDPFIKKAIFTFYRDTVQTALACRLEADDCTVSFFLPEIRLTNVRVFPCDIADTSWYWTCAEYKTGFSWLHFMRYGIINMFLVLSGCRFVSRTTNNDTIAIMSHIKRLWIKTEGLIPFYNDHIILQDCAFIVYKKDGKEIVTATWDSFSKQIDHQLRSKIHIKAGSVCDLYPVTMKDINGTIVVTITSHGDGSEYEIYPEITGVIPEWGHGGYWSVGGSWLYNHGRFFFRNSERSCVCEPIIISRDDNAWTIKLQGYSPITYCARFLSSINIPQPSTGTCTFAIAAHGSSSGWDIDGYCAAEQVKFSALESPITGKSFFLKRAQGWTLGGNIQLPWGDIGLRGEWDSMMHKGYVRCTNQSDCMIPSLKEWVIPPGQAVCNCTVTEKGIVQGAYTITIHNRKLSSDYKVSGDFMLDDQKKYNFSGYWDDYRLFTQGHLKAPFLIDSCIVETARGQPFFSCCKRNDEGSFTGCIYLDEMRRALQFFTGYTCQAQGKLLYKAQVDDYLCDINCLFEKGSIIRLGNTHNFLTGFGTTCHIDIKKRRCHFTQSVFQLYEGVITSPSCIVQYSDNKFFIQGPFLCDRCHINHGEDLFASISGALMVSYPTIKGMVIIHNALLKENIFSHGVRKQMNRVPFTSYQPFLPSFNVDCALITDDPLVVDTPFLKTDAHLALHIENSSYDPFVYGSICFKGGILHFPYHPLFIQSGELLFSSGNDDPFVSLRARNTIKNHDVTLQVSGSLHDHHISLLSTPYLTEEQIMSLLVAGSQESLLNMMIPSLIVQNLPQLIFGSRHASFIDTYFKPLIKPLSINLIPRFADQTGRGGIRGGVEITVNDRIRALIQKNFNLTEDTRFELEYLISDDITIRAIRDERRDIGAELELKWKF